MSRAGTQQRIVVIGAGQAAAQLAISLRQAGHDGAIVIVGAEPYPPYQRPPLSKKFLTERPQPDSLYLRPENFWRGLNIDMRLGVAAIAIDLAGRAVTLTDGCLLAYDDLVLATGTRAAALPLPGATLENVFSLRTIADVQRLRPALDAAERIVIVGGGYIGLEVAAVLRGEGRAVTVVEAQDRLLKRVIAPAVSHFFDRLHRRQGVDIRLGVQLAAILGETHATGMALANGDMLPADVVLLATGARANDELAHSAGIVCADGIVVDEFTRSSAPHVHAIGDCARLPSRRYGRRVRLESVQNAIDQAKAAATALTGAPIAYDPVPWFWSDQYEVKLQIAGLSDGHSRCDIIGRPDAARFSAEYRQNGRLIAVDAVNDARAHMLARRRIADETAAQDEIATQPDMLEGAA